MRTTCSSEGLLTAPRTGKGTRLYASWHAARFRAALMLTGLGIPLENVVALTRARPGAPSDATRDRHPPRCQGSASLGMMPRGSTATRSREGSRRLRADAA